MGWEMNASQSVVMLRDWDSSFYMWTTCWVVADKTVMQNAFVASRWKFLYKCSVRCTFHTCCVKVALQLVVVVLLLRMAYVIYEDNSAMCAAFDKLIEDPPSLASKTLRLMKYDPSVEWPTGNPLMPFLLHVTR